MRHASDPGPHADQPLAHAGVLDPASPSFSPLQPSLGQDTRVGFIQPASPIFNPLQPRDRLPSPMALPHALYGATTQAEAMQTQHSEAPVLSQTERELGRSAQNASGPGWLYSSSFVPLGSAAKHLAGDSQSAIARASAAHMDPQPQLYALEPSAHIGNAASHPQLSEDAGTSEGQVQMVLDSAGGNGQAPSGMAPDSALQPQRLLDRLDAESQERSCSPAAGASFKL